MNTLRPYQAEAVDSVFEQLLEARSTMLVMGTGLGKTTVFSEVARLWEGRVLVLAHRSELIEQADVRLGDDLGEVIGIEKGPSRSTFERVIVGSVQTVHRKHRLERLRAMGSPSLIVIDECHHATSRTYRKVVDAFPSAKVFGVTATPDRGDGKAMGQVFESVCYEYGISQGIEDGWLVPLRGTEVMLGNVNLDDVGTTAGDLAIGALDKAMCEGAEGVVTESMRIADGRQGVVFCPGVQTAHYTAERFNFYKPGSARSVDGTTDIEERRETVRAFKAGEFQWLTNCMVATEGFDAPSAAVISIARPTKSRALYAQMVGRGTRVLPRLVDGIEDPMRRREAIALSSKPLTTIIDFTGINTRHSLASPVDLLGGDYSEAERKVAKKIAAKDSLDGGEHDPLVALEEARDFIRREAARKRAQVEAKQRAFDPMAIMRVDLQREEDRMRRGDRMASQKQIEALRKMGLGEDQLRVLTAAGASALFVVASKRREAKLATMKQLRVLAKHGVRNEKLSFMAASTALNYLASTGWGRNTDMAQLERITS